MLREVIRGDLLSRQRLSAVAAMNAGRYDHLLQQYGHESMDVSVGDTGIDLDFAEGALVWEKGLTLRLPEPLRAGQVELGAGENQRFLLRYFRHGAAIADHEVGAPGRFDPMRRTGVKPAFRSFLAFVPGEARSGFDRVDLLLVHGAHPGWIASVRFPRSRPGS